MSGFLPLFLCICNTMNPRGNFDKTPLYFQRWKTPKGNSDKTIKIKKKERERILKECHKTRKIA